MYQNWRVHFYVLDNKSGRYYCTIITTTTTTMIRGVRWKSYLTWILYIPKSVFVSKWIFFFFFFLSFYKWKPLHHKNVTDKNTIFFFVYYKNKCIHGDTWNRLRDILLFIFYLHELKFNGTTINIDVYVGKTRMILFTKRCRPTRKII